MKTQHALILDYLKVALACGSIASMWLIYGLHGREPQSVAPSESPSRSLSIPVPAPTPQRLKPNRPIPLDPSQAPTRLQASWACR